MSKPVVQRPAADRDLDEIVAYLRRKSGQAAIRFAEAVAATAQLIGNYPAIGSTRHAEICGLTWPLRFHPVAGFPRVLVYYLERQNVVEIVRIWDAARGLEALGEQVIDDPPSVKEPRPAYPVLAAL